MAHEITIKQKQVMELHWCAGGRKQFTHVFAATSRDTDKDTLL